MKAAAVYGRKLGWRVLPVEPGGKKPILKDWTNQASADPERIAEWVAEHPSANVGVATGAGSGVFVLDIDAGTGGLESLAELEAEHGRLPETSQANTPSGGRHYVFKTAAGIANSAGKIAPGVDIRGEGGQFVVAPSKTAKGAYVWVKAPWDVPPADAPAWLLELVSRPSAPKAAPDDRGYFPAASEACLKAARAALEAHGPAVEGEGGDTHTMHAAALLTHDFALTEDEAWPLLEEWNDACSPPWEPGELRTKLRNGSKYGKNEFGCRRAMDAIPLARRVLGTWDRNVDSLPGIMAQLRKVPVDDKTTRALIVKEVQSATGLSEREIDMPKVRAPRVDIKQGEIRISTDLHRVADEAAKAIAPLVFARNGVLCEVVKAERTFIHDLEPARIQDLMSRASKYVREDEAKGTVVQAAPERVATILASRRLHAGIRVLEAVTNAPVFLADGTILQERGYNEQARVFLEPSVEVDVPDEPSKEDAKRAVLAFRDLLCNFKFSEKADFSAWLAGLLSPLVKAATGNAPSPLVCISASSPGAGKSLLADVLARIVMGGPAEIRPYNPRDASEWGKRLTSFVKAASPVNVFDNVNGVFGDEGLDRLITASTWSDRQLGASEAPPLPNVGTWLATGNNIEPINDTVRRVLMVRIEVDVERPQERTDFKQPLLAEYALESRSALLSHALTILRAYHVAGRPDQSLPSWGSFMPWSRLVRGALVWTGLPDPFITQKRAAAEFSEPENEAHDFWISVIEETDGQAVSIATLADQRDAQRVLGLRNEITPFSLKRLLSRFIDKPRAGRRIRRDGNFYRLERIPGV